MAVYRPGFSERVFEFSFNAEFAKHNKAILAAAPEIPTQNEEKFLGYDVAFLLKNRGAIHSLALQHKVTKLVDGKSGSNYSRRQAAGCPYFAFGIDTDQFNLIASIASAGVPGVDFYYSVPLFTTLADLNTHYLTSMVLARSAWIDVGGAGEITDADPHTMIMSSDGAEAFVFSEKPIKLKTLRPEEHTRHADASPLTVNKMRQMYEVAYSELEQYWPRRRKRRESTGYEVFVLPSRLPPKRALPDFRSAVTATREFVR